MAPMRKLSAADAALIARLYHHGNYNGYQVAAILGIGSSTVYKYLCLHKYKAPQWTEEEWRTVERLRLAGHTAEEVGAAIGRTGNAVKIAWHRRGPSDEYKRMQRYLYLLRRTVNKTLKVVNDDPEILAGVEITPRKMARTKVEAKGVIF